MAEDGSSEVIEVDITEWKKMKVAELRKKIGELGLDSKGTKTELIARLEKYLNEQEADLLEEVEEDLEEEEGKVLDDVAEEGEEEGVDNVPNDQKQLEEEKNEGDKKTEENTENISDPGGRIPVVAGTNSQSVADKLKSRQDRFGPSDSSIIKKQARAARFGLALSDYQGLGKRPGIAPTAEEVERMKKRAERFGTTGGSSVLNKIADSEKKSKRAERFGLSAVDQTIKNRKERFGS